MLPDFRGTAISWKAVLPSEVVMMFGVPPPAILEMAGAAVPHGRNAAGDGKVDDNGVGSALLKLTTRAGHTAMNAFVFVLFVSREGVLVLAQADVLVVDDERSVSHVPCKLLASISKSRVKFEIIVHVLCVVVQAVSLLGLSSEVYSSFLVELFLLASS